jgi:hypothetical protein
MMEDGRAVKGAGNRRQVAGIKDQEIALMPSRPRLPDPCLLIPDSELAKA